MKVARDAELPVMIVDPRRRTVTGMNKVFVKTFGCQADAVLGRRWSELVAEDDRSVFRNMLSIVAYGGSRRPEEVTFVGPEGDRRTISVVGVPNVLGDPTAPVALICRPRGESIGQPIGPPEILTADGDRDLERIPPNDPREDRRMNDTSRYLWG